MADTSTHSSKHAVLVAPAGRLAERQGLAPQPLTVGPSSRSAGGVSQTITQVLDTVTVSTTASPTAVGADPGTMIDEIALLHGLGSDLVVTPLARSAGAISQTMATTGSTTTVTRV